MPRPPERLSTADHLGLGIAALLGLGDLASVSSLSQAFDPSQPGPPVDVLATLVAVWLMMLRPRRTTAPAAGGGGPLTAETPRVR